MPNRIAAATCALLIATSSSVSAQVPDHEERGASERGASLGLYVRLPFAGSGQARSGPQLGLRVATLQSYRDFRNPGSPIHEQDAFDLRLAGMGRPTLLIAGHPVSRDREHTLNALGTTETVALAVGGVLLLAVIALAAGGAGPGDTCPTIEGRRDHCINP